MKFFSLWGRTTSPNFGVIGLTLLFELPMLHRTSKDLEICLQFLLISIFSYRNLCRELLPEIRCPTLIVHGNKDAMVASEHPEMLNKRIRGSK